MVAANRASGLLGLLGMGNSVVNAACNSNLVIDNFASWSTNTNSLKSWTSDDSTMAAISAANNVLSFTPKANAYFYESFDCRKTTSDGYNAISFSASAPAANSQMTVEIQTQASCAAGQKYVSNYFTVTGLGTAAKTITVPLSSFAGGTAKTQLDFVSSFAWWGFSNNTKGWQLSNIQFVCGGGSVPVSSPPVVSSSTTKPVTSAASVPATSAATTVKASSSTTSVSSTAPVTTPRASSTTTSQQPTVAPTSTTPNPVDSGSCKPLVIDDWESQSRLTFLYYNAMLKASSDEGSMNSVKVLGNNRMTLTPKDGSSYFYSQTGCTNAKNVYGGISLKITAPLGARFSVQLSSVASCDSAAQDKTSTQTTTALGWKFNGTEQLYYIDFAKFPEVDFAKLNTVLFSELQSAVTFGPMAFYCGKTPSEYTVPPVTQAVEPSTTVPAPAGPTTAKLVIDTFSNRDSNQQNAWHGADDGMKLTWGTNKLTIVSTDPDYSFYTNIAGTCKDMRAFDGGYLHIAYSGSNKFTVALQQHNAKCDETIAPFPETWDSLEAARYSNGKDIYIPMTHFNIERSRVIGVALKGFFSADPVTLTKIEIVNSVPAGFTIPSKLPSGNLVFACKRPNSFAFAIDDGAPNLAGQVMDIIREENIKVTFFTVGAPLEDQSTNLSSIYRDMVSRGHQLALHSYTHPKMEGLADYDAIDWEYKEDLKVVAEQFGGFATKYFRPPFGTEGARMRQRLAVATGSDSPYIVNWSVDVEDWLWAESDTPEKQLDAFKRDVSKGGNLVVLHYLYPSTVSYLRQFIQIAKATGKQLMRVDQCMMDPNAPPL